MLSQVKELLLLMLNRTGVEVKNWSAFEKALKENLEQLSRDFSSMSVDRIASMSDKEIENFVTPILVRINEKRGLGGSLDQESANGLVVEASHKEEALRKGAIGRVATSSSKQNQTSEPLNLDSVLAFIQSTDRLSIGKISDAIANKRESIETEIADLIPLYADDYDKEMQIHAIDDLIIDAFFDSESIFINTNLGLVFFPNGSKDSSSEKVFISNLGKPVFVYDGSEFRQIDEPINHIYIKEYWGTCGFGMGEFIINGEETQHINIF